MHAVNYFTGLIFTTLEAKLVKLSNIVPYDHDIGSIIIASGEVPAYASLKVQRRPCQEKHLMFEK